MPSSTPGTGRGRSHSSVGVMPHAFWLLSRNAVPGNVASTVPLRPYHTKPLGPSFSPDENMPVVGTRETELQPRRPSHAQVPVPFATGQATPGLVFLSTRLTCLAYSEERECQATRRLSPPTPNLPWPCRSKQLERGIMSKASLPG